MDIHCVLKFICSLHAMLHLSTSTSTRYWSLSKRRFWQGNRPEWKATSYFKNVGTRSQYAKGKLVPILLRVYTTSNCYGELTVLYNFPLMRMSVRIFQIVAVSRRIGVTWKV